MLLPCGCGAGVRHNRTRETRGVVGGCAAGFRLASGRLAGPWRGETRGDAIRRGLAGSGGGNRQHGHKISRLDVIWIGMDSCGVFFLLDSAVSIQQRWERGSVDVFSPLLFSRVPGYTYTWCDEASFFLKKKLDEARFNLNSQVSKSNLDH
jgi:hypothetical protein